jgi:hypothetical protein
LLPLSRAGTCSVLIFCCAIATLDALTEDADAPPEDGDAPPCFWDAPPCFWDAPPCFWDAPSEDAPPEEELMISNKGPKCKRNVQC